MKNYKDFINEARKSPYILYHNTYTSAVYEVETYVNKKGYILDPEEMAQTVGMGPRKPGAGKTNKFTIKLYKNKKQLDALKPVRKAVHFQIYGMGSLSNLSADKYELNVYIS